MSKYFNKYQIWGLAFVTVLLLGATMALDHAFEVKEKQHVPVQSQDTASVLR